MSWRDDFARDGYVVLRRAVSEDRVRRARDRIAESLARDAREGRAPHETGGSYCPELRRDPDLLALLEPLRPAIRSAFGERTHAVAPFTAIRRRVLEALGRVRSQRAQIALRFPMSSASGDPRFGLHLDGYPTAQNNVPRGRLYRNTLLAGVYLTPLDGPEQGNLVVWPGSHLRYARFFRELDAPRFLEANGAEALLAQIRAFDAGEPRQLEVQPGDAVLAHHLLGHGTADNLSARVREAIYFRVLHPKDRVSDPGPLLDATRFFDGLPWGDAHVENARPARARG